MKIIAPLVDIFEIPLWLKQILDRRLAVTAPPSSSNEGNNDIDPDEYVNEFHFQLLHRPELWYL